MTVVQGLIRAKDPKNSKKVRPFSRVVANHVLRKKVDIMETAKNIDKLFETNREVRTLVEYTLLLLRE